MKINLINNPLKLDINFAIIVAEFKNYLYSVKKNLDEFDLNICPSQEQKITHILKESPKIFSKYNVFFERLWDITYSFDIEKFKTHQMHLQNEILSFFVTDSIKLNKQIFEKPLGYGGDFIVMNYMYEDGYIGDSTFDILMGRYTLSLPIARAHIHRRAYFFNEINSIINSASEMAIPKITSIACGPAIEILDVLDSFKGSKKAIINCVDGEIKALDQLSENIFKKEKSKKTPFEINIFCENVLNLLRTKKILPQLKNSDLIYCAGFMDYLKDRTCIRLIEYLYALLSQNGKLILVNISSKHSSRAYLEMLGEWYLNHRDETQVKCLSTTLNGIARDITIDSDGVSHTNIYLTIKA